jgi:2-methylisocitrate lyase-like PEP mutase family enzyme
MNVAQLEHARLFHSLHQKGHPLVLFNVWDAGSAKAVAIVGAKAVATGSWAVATAHGYDDGEVLPLQFVLDNLRRIVTSVNLPVSVDLEAGYGTKPDTVAETVAEAIAAGAVGCNLEDRIVHSEGLFSISDQAARISAARAAADKHGLPFFINARSDVFFQGEPVSEALAENALERAKAYAVAGASGLFLPGLVDFRIIGKLCDASPLPINVLMWPGLPHKSALIQLGVSRISHGGAPYREAMHAFSEAAKVANA